MPPQIWRGANNSTEKVQEEIMKESFIERKFTPQSLMLLKKIDAVLEDYEAQGYDLSLRQLYYQLVSANIIPNSERSYKNIGSLVNDARMAGLIDWDLIKDRGREMISNSHWDKPADILISCVHSFQTDKWMDQENYVEVMVEKQALEGVLEPVCKKLDIPFTANKGYSSASAMYEASKRFLERKEQDKNLFVIYLGDHDPSGIDMTRDVNERLNLFIQETDHLEVKRIALNMDQIERLRPPENPAKLTDSRATQYIRRFGKSSWELDAIEPKQLARLVEKAVLDLRDDALWEKACLREEKMKDELRGFAAKSKFSK
jgi:hypothetical protein